MGHATLDRHVEIGHFAELVRIVRLGENGLREVLAHLILVNVESGAELDVTYVVSTEARVHQPWYEFVVRCFAVVLYTLHQGRGAVSHADNCYPDFFVWHLYLLRL